MKTHLRILFVEGGLHAFAAVQDQCITQQQPVEWQRVSGVEELRAAIETKRWDLIISEYALPHSGFERNWPLIQPLVERLPLLLLCRAGDEQAAVQRLYEGAWDYLLADNLNRLVPAIRRAVKHVAQLDSSESLYRTLVENMPLAMMLSDAKGNVIAANPAAAKLQGFTSSADALGRHLSSLVTMDERARVNAEFTKASTEDKIISFESRVLREDGSTRPAVLSGVVIRDGVGQLTGLVALAQDITDRKKAEEEIRRQSGLINCLIDSIPDLIFFKDLKGVYLGGNPAFADFVGRPREQIVGLTDHDLFGPAIAEAFRAYDKKMLETLTPRQNEEWVTYPDGRRKLLDTLKTPYRGPTGELLGVLGVSRDITERKQREEISGLHLRTLELLAAGAPLTQVLEAILTQLEYGHSDWLGSVMLLDESGSRLVCEAAPRLPGFYREAIRGVPVADGSGSCGTATALKQVVIVEDIDTHPYWTAYREVASRAGLRACWSIPILTAKDGILGTLAIYHRRPCAPSREELKAIGVVVDLAGIAVGKIRAEEALRDREEIFSNIIAQAADAIMVVDGATGKFIEFNRAAHETLGYQREEFSTLSVADIQADFSAQKIQQIHQTLRVKGALGFETQHRHHDGSLRDVRVNLRPLAITKHNYLAAVWTDITEWKRAKANAARDTLRTNFLLELHHIASQMTDKELYNHVLDQAVRLTGSALGCFHLVSEDQRRIESTTWNQAALKDWGGLNQAQESPAAGNWMDCIRERRAVIRNQRSFLSNSEELPSSPDSHSLHRCMSVPVIREGKVRIVFGVANKATDYDDSDIAQLQVIANDLHKIMLQRAAQNQVRQSEQRFRSLVETTFDWIWEVDANGRYTYASPRVEELLGYTPEEVVGRTPFELMPPAEAQRVGAVFVDLATRRIPFSSLENINLHRNGRQVIFETSGAPIFGDNGEFLGYRGMDRDITERKRLESKLQQSQKLEAIGQLAGGVAHDFNNILAAILMQVGLLQMGSSLDPESSQALKDLEAEARRAASLTRQLLMFSRRSVLDVQPLDLNEIVMDLLKMLGRLIGEQTRLLFDGQPGILPAVAGDGGMMEQVLMNLVVNARDAMPKGGNITIKTSVENLSEDQSRVKPDGRPGKFVCLAVSDTGIGMAKETLERIFEPFFTTKEPGKGTGLGLATVHGIVAQHKGWVEVESKLDCGTTFRVFLPAIAQPVPEVVKPSPPQTASGGTEVILLVEDEPSVRRSVGKSLRRLGYTIHEAENGPQALALWEKHADQIHLLLTDMVMPDGPNGLELAERLMAAKPSLRVIISSGYSSELFQTGGINRSGISYLPKPYETKALARLIRSCLEIPV